MFRPNPFSAFAAALAALLTLVLHSFGMHPVLSSAAVTLLLVGTFTTLSVGGECGPAIMCGSFSGMSLLPDLLLHQEYAFIEGMIFSLLISLAVGVLYSCIHCLSEHYPSLMLNGFGGKLGAIAFVATLLSTLSARWLLGMPFPSVSLASTLTRFQESFFSSVTLFSMMACVSGSVLPLLIQKKGLYQLGANARVVVTALWGLCIGGLLLLIPIDGGVLASCWSMGTFVSMTAREIISPLPFLMIAGVLASIFLKLLCVSFHGFGGLLGVSAFLAVIVTYLMEPLRLHLTNRLLPDRS